MLARTNIPFKDHKTIREGRNLHSKHFSYFSRWVPLMEVESSLIGWNVCPTSKRLFLRSQEDWIVSIPFEHFAQLQFDFFPIPIIQYLIGLTQKNFNCIPWEMQCWKAGLSTNIYFDYMTKIIYMYVRGVTILFWALCMVQFLLLPSTPPPPPRWHIPRNLRFFLQLMFYSPPPGMQKETIRHPRDYWHRLKIICLL